MKMWARVVATGVALVALVFGGAAPAMADAAPTVQEQVDAAMAAVPGGVQTAWNEVSWDDGDVVLTVAADAGTTTESAVVAAAVGSCATGKVCAYSSTGYAGSKLTFSSCTSSMSLSALPTVRSVANARSANTVKVYNGSTLVATLTHGTGKNVAGATKLSCS